MDADPTEIALDALFGKAVEDANYLLGHSAEDGLQLSRDVIDPIVQAKAAVARGSWSPNGIALFYTAFAALANATSPVTAETVRACSAPLTMKRLQHNRICAFILTLVIVGLSALSFIDSSLSNNITQDIDKANSLSSKLSSRGLQTDPGSFPRDACLQLDDDTSAASAGRGAGMETAGSPGLGVDDISQLQEFASAIRDMHKQATKLNFLVAYMETEPLIPTSQDISLVKRAKSVAASPPDDKVAEGLYQRVHLQLTPGLRSYSHEVLCKIYTLQEVRDYARNVQTDNATVIGALSAYILPVLYAWLGGLAYRLRSFSDTIKKRTYHPSFADSARLLVAIMAGAIVGLFNTFTQGMSLSPLAIAFLVGYAVEIFFSFLDALMNSFGKAAGPESRASGSSRSREPVG